MTTQWIHPDHDAPPSALVTATPETRLAQLQAMRPALKAAAEAASAALMDNTDALKAELTAAAPNAARVDLVPGAGPGLQLTYSERWTVDSKRLKAEQPELYVTYAKKGGSWSLSETKAGQS